MLDIIEKTRDNIPLSEEDIERLVSGIVENQWPDYQLAAWLMAVVWRGLSAQETFWLTGAMAFSNGQPAPLGLVDKHSTGGVGDKTTLVLAPLAASLGLPMAKMSGRGLGHTGGTLDKLESIPGFRTGLTTDEVKRQIDAVGVAVVAQSAELAPADKRLYALRDVTGTVNSRALIASSIMSKKLAAGTPNLVLDVKVGSGAFMTTTDKARDLAKLMVAIGRFHHRRVTAVITGMQQPLGWAVGNAIEVNEAVDCLLGKGPDDLRDEVIMLAAELLYLSKGVPLVEGHKAAGQALQSGRALERFYAWIQVQGADAGWPSEGLPLAPVRREWKVSHTAHVRRIDARLIGQAALELGAGRHRLEDQVDPAVGLHCYAKVGHEITPDHPAAVVYARSDIDADQAIATLEKAVLLGEGAAPLPLVYDRISDEIQNDD